MDILMISNELDTNVSNDILELFHLRPPFHLGNLGY